MGLTAMRDIMAGKAERQVEAQTTQDSDPVQDLRRQQTIDAEAAEQEIMAQEISVGFATLYFGNGYFGAFPDGKRYATATQLKRLAHKHRSAVEGINPWEHSENGGFDAYSSRNSKLDIPESKTCEFCGKQIDYIGRVICNKDSRQTKHYEYSVEKWSLIPQRCDCEQAAAHWTAHDDEEKCKEEERRQREQDEAAQRRVEEKFTRSGMKTRFLTRTFSNFVQDTPQRAACFKVAKGYADNFTAHLANGDGLFIEGTYGTGKTHLAAAISIQLMQNDCFVLFRTTDDLLRDIKATFDEGGNAEEKVLKRFKTCDLLVIDDLGKEQVTEWSTAQLYAIINDRYENQKPVIITTNFNEDDLVAIESPKGIGEHRIKAILSRLHEVARGMTMAWEDYRSGGGR